MLRNLFHKLLFQLPFAQGQDDFNKSETFIDVHCKLTGLECASNMKYITVKQNYQFRQKFPRSLSFDKVCIQQCTHINSEAMKNTEKLATNLTISPAETTRFVKILYFFFLVFLEFK